MALFAESYYRWAGTFANADAGGLNQRVVSPGELSLVRRDHFPAGQPAKA